MNLGEKSRLHIKITINILEKDTFCLKDHNEYLKSSSHAARSYLLMPWQCNWSWYARHNHPVKKISTVPEISVSAQRVGFFSIGSDQNKKKHIYLTLSSQNYILYLELEYKVHVIATKKCSLNWSAFYQHVRILFNSLFKVLFIFPSRYLYAKGLSLMISLLWISPHASSSITKERYSKT